MFKILTEDIASNSKQSPLAIKEWFSSEQLQFEYVFE